HHRAVVERDERRRRLPVRARVSRLSAGASALIAIFGAAGLASPLAAASTTAQAAAISGPDRSNVGATHSPQLLQQLAGPAGAARAASRSDTSRAAAPGALRGVDAASSQPPGNAAIAGTRGAGDGIQSAAVKAPGGNYYKTPSPPADLAGAQAAGL